MFLLLFLSAGALFGGYTMIADPSGGLLGAPLGVLEGSPFKNFFIPGAILFGVLGVLPLLTVIALWFAPIWRLVEGLEHITHHHWAWLMSLVVGLALVIWMSVQGLMLGFGHPIQWFYLGLGFTIIALNFLPSVQRHYSLRGKP